MITEIDFIIAMVLVVVSLCAIVVIGVLVYLLNKKHDEDIDWLFNMICNNKTEVNRFYEEYKNHEYNCHKCFERHPEEN